MLYLRAQKELEAHTWWFCSTYEYIKSCEYELLTPSEQIKNIFNVPDVFPLKKEGYNYYPGGILYYK